MSVPLGQRTRSLDAAEINPGFQGAKECEPDFHFRCSHCIQLIGEDMPVYMHKDRTYCSGTCRTKGRSALYRHLRELQLDQAAHGVRGSQCSQSSGVDSRSERSVMSSCQSDSTLNSCQKLRKSGSYSDEARGPLSWIFRRVVCAVVNRMPNPEMVRSASSVLQTRLMHDSSFTRLGAFLPSATSFISRTSDPDPDMSTCCSSHSMDAAFYQENSMGAASE